MPGSPESSALCRRVGEIEGFGGLAELVEIGRAAGIVTFGALAASEPVADKDLTLLNRALAEAPKRERLAQADEGYAWDTRKIVVSAAGLLAPVMWSAADLLTRARSPGAALRQRGVPVAVHRREQGRHPPLVRHELMRQPRQIPPPLSEDEGKPIGFGWRCERSDAISLRQDSKHRDCFVAADPMGFRNGAIHSTDCRADLSSPHRHSLHWSIGRNRVRAVPTGCDK